MRDSDIVLTPDAARRIAAAVKTVEAMTRGAAPGQSQPRHIPYQKVGKLTTALTARSGSTPGSGSIQPYLLTATTMTSRGVVATIHNWTGTAVSSGLGVKYTVIDGVLFFDGQDCSGVAFP